MANITKIKIGDNVYTLANIQNVTLTSSEGLNKIVALVDLEDGKISYPTTDISAVIDNETKKNLKTILEEIKPEFNWQDTSDTVEYEDVW